jgi:hypothetical protein
VCVYVYIYIYMNFYAVWSRLPQVLCKRLVSCYYVFMNSSCTAFPPFANPSSGFRWRWFHVRWRNLVSPPYIRLYLMEVFVTLLRWKLGWKSDEATPFPANKQTRDAHRAPSGCRSSLVRSFNQSLANSRLAEKTTHTKLHKRIPEVLGVGVSWLIWDDLSAYMHNKYIVIINKLIIYIYDLYIYMCVCMCVVWINIYIYIHIHSIFHHVGETDPRR